MQNREPVEKAISARQCEAVQAIGQHFNRRVKGQHQTAWVFPPLVKQKQGQHQHGVHDQQMNGLLHNTNDVSGIVKVKILLPMERKKVKNRVSVPDICKSGLILLPENN